MDTQYLEFSKHSFFPFMRSPAQFRRFAASFWLDQSFKNPDGFALSPVQPSGVVGQGALK